MSETDQTQTWIAAAQAGDRLALTKLLTTCHQRLRARAAARLPAALKSKRGPDDILQEVYLDVFQQIGRFENHGPGSFLNWMYAILDNKLAAAKRAAHCQVRDVDREVALIGGDSNSYWNLLDTVYAESGTPSRVVRREEAFGALVRCLDDMSVAHREVIRLRFLEGLALEEVAERLDKSKAAVVALTKRALEALRRSMDQLGEFTRGA